MKHASKNAKKRCSWSDRAKRWARVGLLSGCALATARCGQNSTSNAPSSAGARNDGGESGAAGSTHNECDGDLALRFASKDAHVNEACGECNDGHLICGAPNVLVCLGARATQPGCDATPDGGVSNLCGGSSELEFAGQPAAPGGGCGPCDDGVLICASPTLLSCYGSHSTNCADGGAPGNDAGASGALSGSAGLAGNGTSGVGGTAGTGGISGGGSSNGGALTVGAGGCTGPGYQYLGHSATVGDACGSCADGKLVCFGGSSKTLSCSGATPTGYCGNSSAAPNECGGIGPVLWSSTPSSPGVRCGGCGYAQLGCATKNQLTCTGQTIEFSNAVCAQPPEYATCTIPASAYSASPAHTPPAPLAETKPTASSFQSMNLTVNAIAYNAFDRRLYATVPSSDGPNGNSVAVIDPAAQQVLQYVPVGSEPHALAISDDGKVLWVINAGSNTLRRVDLTTLTTGPVLPLGDTDYGKVGQRLSILPGTQDSVIVGSNGLTIYDNGVPRIMAATTDGLLTSATNSPWLAYAYNNNDTGYDFVTLCINQYGIFAQASHQNLLSGGGANLLFNAGIVYGSNAAYDISKQALIGSYPVADAVAIDPANRRIFTLRHFGTTQFVAYDMDTFAVIGNDPAFPSIKIADAQLVRWGRYGIAFTDSTDIFGQPSLHIGKSVIVP